MRNVIFSIIFVAFLYLFISSSTKQENQSVSQKDWPIIYISFEKYGTAIDRLNQRLAETEKISKSKDQGSDIWLRLHNNSKWAILIKTDSLYLGQNVTRFQLSDGTTMNGLKNGMEASVQYHIQENDGRFVSQGLDNSSASWLPSGHSVLFSVKRGHLAKGRMIYVDFNYEWEREQNYSNNLMPVHRSEYYSYRLENDAKK